MYMVAGVYIILFSPSVFGDENCVGGIRVHFYTIAGTPYTLCMKYVYEIQVQIRHIYTTL